MLEHLLRHIEFLDDAIATYDRHVERLTAPQAAALAGSLHDSRRRAPHGRGDRRRTGLRYEALPHRRPYGVVGRPLPAQPRERRQAPESGCTRLANRTLRAALVEGARGAVRTRNGYLAAQYRRLVKRRGDKKAIVAVAHSILVIASHVLRDSQSYRELGGGYFDRLNTDRLLRYHTKRLAALRYTVTLAKHAA